jgi:hypothetical protein
MVTLYTGPREEKPYVQMAALQEGRYVEVNYMALRTFICFADIGATARKVAMEMDERVTISLVGYSWLEEDKSWIVVFEGGKVNLVLSCQRYKHFGSFDKAFYISLGVSGNEEQVRAFTTRFQKALGRNPLEGLDFAKLQEDGIVSKADAESAWKKYGPA